MEPTMDSNAWPLLIICAFLAMVATPREWEFARRVATASLTVVVIGLLFRLVEAS